MDVREEQGEKRAVCPKCGHVVLIPDKGFSGIRSRRKGRLVSRTDELERTTSPVEQPGPPAETDSGADRPIHEQTTRVESVPADDRSLTAFLAPPEGPGEIGRLGGYRVLAVVGSGGMGVVFRAEDPVLERVVALKAMLPALAISSTARQRFLREAKAAAALQHDHIVTIYQVGEDRGVPFLAMPFLEGEPLDRRLARVGGPLPAGEVLRIGREISLGLSAIHQRGLIHRDIKPANVWLEGEPGAFVRAGSVSDGLSGEPGALATGGRVKILDFGLARATQGDIQLTQEGAIVGSPAYMAPEQANRQAIDHRCDLFSLGCVMYFMATGRLPFEAPDALTTLLAVTTAVPPSPESINSALPLPVAELVMYLLAKKPEDRPESASAVVERIKELEDDRPRRARRGRSR
jgi:serine/threonine protein kinase